MGFCQVNKSNAYFKRFQVKFARRRCGKTDYRARQRLILQDKNKYNSPKYRFCVRVSNKTVTCQVIYATLQGDKVMCAAYSSELPRYGLKVGLKNYAACYATGLLLARRLLNKLGMEEKYEGVEEPDGEEFHVEDADDAPRAFRCNLDVGLVNCTTGQKAFGAMKGAVDGGLAIPHNCKRFPGYDKDEKAFDAEVLGKYIHGGHVAEYMEGLEEEDNEKYQAHFAKYIEQDIDADSMEDLYKEVHKKIRESPQHVATKKKIPKKKDEFKHRAKRSYAQRKDRVRQIVEHRNAKAADGNDSD